MPRMVNNDISIARVANGFIVHMPMPYEREDGPAVADQMTKSREPFLEKVLQMRDRDPLIERLQRDAREEEPEQPKPEPVQQVGQDSYTHVFATWDGVIDFLSKLQL